MLRGRLGLRSGLLFESTGLLRCSRRAVSSFARDDTGVGGLERTATATASASADPYGMTNKRAGNDNSKRNCNGNQQQLQKRNTGILRSAQDDRIKEGEKTGATLKQVGE
jgi:hypothetical protein